MIIALVRCIKISLGTAFLLLIISSPVYANVGLPMLAIVWPLFWYAFIPIVAIEYWVIRKKLKPKSRELLNATIIANLGSTAIGLPVTWFVLVFLEFLLTGGSGDFSKLPIFWEMLLTPTLGAPWLSPYESELYWMVPVACAVLLVPFYFMSSWVEVKIVARYSEDSYTLDEIKMAVWRANRASYAFLYVIVISWLVYAIITKSLPFS